MDSKFVYREELETPPTHWGCCCHCGQLAEEFCTRCRPLGSFWCRACCKAYHGWWKQTGRARVFVPTKWTRIFHEADRRLARKSEKDAHKQNHKKELDYRARNQEAELGEIEIEWEEPTVTQTLATPTIRRSAKRRTTRGAIAKSAAGATTPVTDSKSVTSAVTSVLSARNFTTRLLVGFTKGRNTLSKSSAIRKR